MKALPRAFFTLIVFCSVIFASCATVSSSSSDSFDGLWTKRECAQIASDFVSALDSSSFAESFFKTHGHKPLVAVGFISSSGSLALDTAPFAGYIVSDARKAKSFDIELYEKKVFASEKDALLWALDNGIDFLITGSIQTVKEEVSNARPLLRYNVSLEVLDLSDGQSPAYRWKDSHLAKDIRRITQ